MTWTIEFAPRAEKQIDRLDATVRARILQTLRRNMSRHAHPRDFGDALVGKFTGLWKYRIGDYRVIARIEDERVTILVVEVGHRSDVYR